jgi:hypothetical protein
MAFCVVADKTMLDNIDRKRVLKMEFVIFMIYSINILILRLWATTFAILRVIEHPTSLILMTRLLLSW